MKVLAFAATNHKESINKKLVEYTTSVLQDNAEQGIEVEILDLVDYELPFYRQDREQADGIPEGAKEFYSKIGEADALIISFAEHNGTFTAVYKNLFDWMSRIDMKVYQDKPTILMATSPGARGGAGVLGAVEMGAPFFGMDIKSKISVPTFQDNFDSDRNEVVDSDIADQVKMAVSTL